MQKVFVSKGATLIEVTKGNSAVQVIVLHNDIKTTGTYLGDGIWEIDYKAGWLDQSRKFTVDSRYVIVMP